jgi:hypothetical protein
MERPHLVWNGSSVWKNQAFWHLKATTSKEQIIWPPGYGYDVLRESHSWVQAFQQWLLYLTDDQLR